jgi:hypothetical protein
MESNNGRYTDYSVEGYIVESPEDAVVFVSYTYEYTDRNKEFEENMEPWGCVKVNGQWKVRWLPRQ